MKIAILGYGTVGRGVDEIISSRVDTVEVKRILELPDRLSDERMTANYDDIVGDAEIELVVECMGGIEPAHTFIRRALEAKKHVVTSNKAVVAAHFAEFAEIATAKGVAFLVEAAVAGGIPWIASIEKVRRIDCVSSFTGIMNGTTNYIVDLMERDGVSFEAALARAQELGYAEADPSADIDGIDVRNKTIITATVAFGVSCTPDLPVTGIRTLTKDDLGLFRTNGFAMRLLGTGVAKDGRYAVSVEPHLVDVRSLEAAVPLNFNLVSLEGATIGPLKFYGQGAGSLPTGNAIVQDVLDAAAGRRSVYDFSAELAYDPSLLAGDYVVRSRVRPEGGAPMRGVVRQDGVWIVRDLTPPEARALIEDIWQQDETAFIAAAGKGVFL